MSAQEKAPLIEIRHFTRIYQGKSVGNGAQRGKIVAVDDVSFTLHKGEILGLLGPSGCGKSTLARMIVGLEPRDQGELVAAPSFTKEHPPLLQMIFQDPFSSLNPRMMIGESVEEPLILRPFFYDQNGEKRKLTAREREKRVTEILEKVGLAAKSITRYPHQFSGGQRQRIALARALIASPDLLVADEPVSALDISIQAQILNLLQDIREVFGLSILFISHDVDVVHYLSDHVLRMEKGKIVNASSFDKVD